MGRGRTTSCRTAAPGWTSALVRTPAPVAGGLTTTCQRASLVARCLCCAADLPGTVEVERVDNLVFDAPLTDVLSRDDPSHGAAIA